MAGFEVAVKIDDARLRALSASLVPSLRDVVRVAAHGVEGRGKQRVPVDTGATKNSIQPEFSQGGLAARIGPSTSYAPFLEFGTHRMAARPFMVPALEEERGPFIAAVERVVSRG